MAAIRFTINVASSAEISEHLLACNALFMPPLSERVDIQAYTAKLIEKSRRMEAWAEDRLVGLVAVYCNDHITNAAFITSVSVLPEWQKKGIALELTNHCVEDCRVAGMRRIELEVSRNSESAIRLYKKCDFVASEMNEFWVCMNLDL